MHSHLEVGLRAQLTRMSKEELLAVLDFVSKEDTVCAPPPLFFFAGGAIVVAAVVPDLPA